MIDVAIDFKSNQLQFLCDMHVCEQSPWLRFLLTKLRDESTSRSDFRNLSSLLGEYLVIQAVNLGYIPTCVQLGVKSPTGVVIDNGGLDFPGNDAIMAVSIVRAGNAFIEPVLRIVSRDLQIGQLVIQRDEATALPKTILEKLPTRIAHAECVIVLDPMLATGGSILAAIDILVDRGVAVEKIVLIHALGCPEGIGAVQARYPGIRAVIGVEDSHLNKQKYIIPGLGDFGDRYYCT